MLPGRSARCVGAAHDLYGRILDRIEAQGYDVFAGRARVPTPRKLAVAGATPAPADGAAGSPRRPAAATAAGMIAFPLAAPGRRGPPGDLATSSSAGWPRRRRAVAPPRWGAGRAARAGVGRRRGDGGGRARRHVDRAAVRPLPLHRAAAAAGRRRAGRRPGWRGGRWRCRPARSPTPCSAGARRRARRIALGAAALTAWDLFLDPQMTAEGYWRWDRGGPLPRHPAVATTPAGCVTGAAVMARARGAAAAAARPRRGARRRVRRRWR